MFEDQLIREVGKKKCLWDKNSPTYRSKLLIEQAWIHISHVLGESGEYCRTRWKSLRDRFVMECKLKRSGNSTRKKWQHFDQLMFLRKCVTGRAKLIKEQNQDVEDFCESQDMNMSETQDTHTNKTHDMHINVVNEANPSEFEEHNTFDNFSFVNTGEMMDKALVDNDEEHMEEHITKIKDENSEENFVVNKVKETPQKVYKLVGRTRPLRPKEIWKKAKFNDAVGECQSSMDIKQNTTDPFLAAIGEIFTQVPAKNIKFKLDILNYTYKKFEELDQTNEAK